jgi:hypothetical protein
MVPRAGLDSNHLFDELDRWADVLRHLETINTKDESIRLRGKTVRYSRSPRARKVKRAGGGV